MSSDHLIIFPNEGPIADTFEILNLPSPKLKDPRRFIVYKQQLFELQRMKTSVTASWFLDDNVKSDGSVLLASLFNPLFLILELLIKNSNRSCPLIQILLDVPKDSKNFSFLVTLNGFIEKVKSVCDVIDGFTSDPEDIIVKLNNEKLMNVLSQSLKRTCDIIKSQEIRDRKATDNSNNTFFVSSEESINMSGMVNENDLALIEKCMFTSWSIMGEFLPTDVHLELAKINSIDPAGPLKNASIISEPSSSTVVVSTVTKKEVEVKIDSKPVKSSGNVVLDDDAAAAALARYQSQMSSPSPMKKISEPILTPAQKKLQQADKTGMKSIFSYFGMKK